MTMKNLIWKIAAIVAGVTAVVGVVLAISRTTRRKDDGYCWPNNEEFRKCNDEAWNMAM